MLRITRTKENCARVLGIIKENGEMTCREIVREFTGKRAGSGGYSGVANDISDILSWLGKQGCVSKTLIRRGHERCAWRYVRDMTDEDEEMKERMSPGAHKLKDFTALIGEQNMVVGLYTNNDEPVTLKRADGRVVALPLAIGTVRKGLREGGWKAEW